MGPQVGPQELGLPGGNSGDVKGTLSIWRAREVPTMMQARRVRAGTEAMCE